jgi:flavin reductase (DIM6/NTAB) family NADH-FMN oxidoreductase RutF
MGHFASGVGVMTTRLDKQLHGMTVSAFSSVSLNPLLVVVAVEKVTLMHKLAALSRVYAVSILGAQDEAISRFFADDRRLDGPEFLEGTYRTGVTGSPILKSANAFLETEVREIYPGGDHDLFLGEVVALGVLSENPPLIFYRGGYTTLKA